MRLKGAAAGQVLRPRSARALFSQTRSPSAAPGPGPAQERRDSNAETPAPARRALPPDAGEPVGPGLPGQEPGTGRDRETQRGARRGSRGTGGLDQRASWVRGRGPPSGAGVSAAELRGWNRAAGPHWPLRAGDVDAMAPTGCERGRVRAGGKQAGASRQREVCGAADVPLGNVAQPRGYLTH